MALPVQQNEGTVAGNTGGTLESTEEVFDPESGYQVVETWTGPKEAIDGRFNTYAVAGWKCSKSQNGPQWRMVAQIAREIVADRWDRTIELAQIDLKANIYLLQQAGSSLVLAQWIADIKADLAKNIPSGVTGSTAKQTLYDYMACGMENFQTRRYVLRRQRMRPANQIGAAAPADAIDNVYYRGSLISGYAVPASVAVLLPAVPSLIPVPNTAWGWWERTDDVQIIPYLNKAVETKEWVFAAWPTLYYNFI